jgi:NAD(P)H-dependent nitrite reductase small subunit
MYYILTADRLERTAVWQRKLPNGKNGGGPIEHLKEVIIEDSLGICEELDRRMEHLVSTYHDEWVSNDFHFQNLPVIYRISPNTFLQAEVVKDPERRAKFKQFVNSDKTIDKENMIEFVDMRGQNRPADWPKDGQPQTNWQAPPNDVFANSEKSWVFVGKSSAFAANVGSQILYGDTQLAVFNNEQRGEWYCTQNMCPHKQAFVLSQGLLGDASGVAKVACPLHKKQFSLHSGEEIGGNLQLITFPVKIENDEVFVELPNPQELDAILGTSGLRVQKSDCIDISGDAIKIPITNRSFLGGTFAKVGKDILNSVRKETVLRAETNNSTSTES